MLVEVNVLLPTLASKSTTRRWGTRNFGELETFEDNFSDGFVGLDRGVSGAQVFGGDASGDGAESCVDESFIDKCRYLFEGAVLLDHVRGLEDGAGEHGLPVQRCGFQFELAGIDEVGIIDESEGALRGDEFDDLVEVLIGVGEADDEFDVLNAELADFFAEVLRVVHGVVGTGF